MTFSFDHPDACQDEEIARRYEKRDKNTRHVTCGIGTREFNCELSRTRARLLVVPAKSGRVLFGFPRNSSVFTRKNELIHKTPNTPVNNCKHINSSVWTSSPYPNSGPFEVSKMLIFVTTISVVTEWNGRFFGDRLTAQA